MVLLMPMTPPPSSTVDTTLFHLWTDALYGRALARRASNAWDRGTCVRWAIISAWTAFEIACADTLSFKSSERFKDNATEAIARRGLPEIDWGRAPWQVVLEIQQLRIDYVHRHLPQSRLVPTVDEATKAIVTLRCALKDLCIRVGKPAPTWIEEEEVTPQDSDSTTVASAVIRAGAREDDPDAVRVVYVYSGNEVVSEVLPPGTDPTPVMDRLAQTVAVPITAIRAYRGADLIEERSLTMRGA